MKNKKKSFSLIELLIVITILSTFFVIAISIAAATLRDMKIQEHKILATYYAEEAKEWLTHLKENDWNLFKDKASTTGKNYCINNLADGYNWIEGDCLSFSLNNFYKREMKLTYNEISDQINVLIAVSWNELGKNYKINLPLVFTLWE